MSKLFELNPEQLELTNAMIEVIQGHIGDKYISFNQYMNLALYHGKYGYYNNLLHKFGFQGDYVTSPLVSELFGIAISKQIHEIFSRGIEKNILEFGAGNGQLMLDILSAIGDNIKHYYIVDLSGSLKSLQQSRLLKEKPQYKDKVTWLSALPEEFEGIILANEILDAIPCDIVHWKNGDIYSKVVTTKDNKFVFADIKADDKILEIAKNLPIALNEYISEISLERTGFLKTLSETLAKGVILLIDYGYGETEYYSVSRSHGTLRGFFRQHQLDDVLIYPGLIDITSSVDFTAVAKAGIANNLDLVGYTTQASFLINCGILDELEKMQVNSKDTEYLQLTNQLNRLISPNEMGEIFKVIAFSKNLDDTDYVGFKSGDKTYTL